MTETVFERAKFALGIKTNKELAEKLGQAETTVSGWKSRDTIPVDYLLLISKLSNVPVDWILKGKDSCFPVPKNAIAPKYKSDDDFDAVNEDRIEKHLNMIVFTRAEAIAAGELRAKRKTSVRSRSGAAIRSAAAQRSPYVIVPCAAISAVRRSNADRFHSIVSPTLSRGALRHRMRRRTSLGFQCPSHTIQNQ